MDHNRDQLEDIQSGLSQEQFDVRDAIQSLQEMISEIERIVFEKEPPHDQRSW
jgi:23S rRNA maturation-related 3'-5' exoribonuclease YhaM